jgi:hypothetical protein
MTYFEIMEALKERAITSDSDIEAECLMSIAEALDDFEADQEALCALGVTLET